MEKVFHEMLRFQEMLNTEIASNWRERKFDWRLAIFMECAEVVDCFPWKWWVDKKEIDEDNLKIELVDILHFLLAWYLEEKPTREAEKAMLANLKSLEGNTVKDLARAFDYVRNLARDIICPSYPSVVIVFSSFYKLALLCGYNFETLAKIYFGKNALNKLRQRYKKDYIKLWDGVEDNYYMLKAIDNIEYINAEQFVNDVYNLLEREYIFVSTAKAVNG